MKKWWSPQKASPLQPLEGYNLWANRYNSESNPIKDGSDKIIHRFLPDLQKKTVLDAGCGTGKFCKYAEEQQAADVTGIDLSPVMIEQARQFCKRTEFKTEDLSNVQLPSDKFDVIICGLVLGHIKDLAPVLQQLANGLRSGGTLIITDFHPYLTLTHAKRTFVDTSGKTHEIVHHLHHFSDYVKAFKTLGLIVVDLDEVIYNDHPVVFGFCLRKSK